MNLFGQLILLAAFVAAVYSAFACALGWRFNHQNVRRSGHYAALASVGALTALIAILAYALIAKDFRFAYVASYSSNSLPWHYSLSALWVGQSGSLLLWSWFLGIVSVLYRFWPRNHAGSIRDLTFSILLAYLAFLVAVMVFGADPMEAGLSTPREGIGLSPQLQHPAMLIHPPIVFLGYAIWAVPFALALSALWTGQIDRDWAKQSRSWSLWAWVVLGLGIILGAEWAYEELGWGGYWSWDPVENGSLMPWLTGTAFIHCALAWKYRGQLKKTAILLAVVTFGLCNFAAFLTRSGIFGSLHEFSQSPIGWLFLVLMAMLVFVAVVMIPARRMLLTADSRITGILSREAFVVISTVALLALTSVIFLGTLAVPLSGIILPRRIMVGPEFYNYTLIPLGVVILATTAIAPVLRWGAALNFTERTVLIIALVISAASAIQAVLLGLREPILIAVVWAAALALWIFAGQLYLDYRAIKKDKPWAQLFNMLRIHRRRYAAFVVHLGFVCLAVGVTASSLGVQRYETAMQHGETISWANRSIRFAGIDQQRSSEKLVVAAQIDVTDESQRTVRLLPAQHLHLLQNQWTTEVAIDSTWTGDFYVILHSGTGEERINLSFVINPLMRWIWLGGTIICLGALAALWPAKVVRKVSAVQSSGKRIVIHPASTLESPRLGQSKQKSNSLHDPAAR